MGPPRQLSPLHRWDVTPEEGIALQRRLARRVRATGDGGWPRLVAGADAIYSRGEATGYAAVVVWDLQSRQVVEVQRAQGRVAYPYVPGLLSFREAPLLLRAVARLHTRPEVILVDGQGLAHPRRFGLACHLGVWLQARTLGCAKSRLFGVHRTPGERRGARAPLRDPDTGEPVGAVVRTRDRVRPVFVSVGHRMDLEEAVSLVLACSDRFRLPEPVRLADGETRRMRRAASET